MNFTLKIAGTASARPVTGRYPSAQVLDVRGRLFLFDCGEGTQMRLLRMGISIQAIDTICISHIHGDHLFGIFGLLSTMGMLGRTRDLDIFAPRSFGPVLKFFLSYFGEGLKFRIEHHQMNMKSPEPVLTGKSFTLTAFPLKHRVETFGYMVSENEPLFNVRKEKITEYGLLLSEIAALKRGENIVRKDGTVILNSDVAYKPYKPRRYAYCSDTAPFPELSGWVEGVDLLYHEATFPESLAELAGSTFHSTTVQAAECAAAAKVGKLVVGHYSSRFRDVSFYLDEMQRIFPNVELAREGSVFEVPLEKNFD